MGATLNRIDSLYQGDRIRDLQGNIGWVRFLDQDAPIVEWTDGSRHMYEPTTEVERLDPEPRPAVLGGC